VIAELVNAVESGDRVSRLTAIDNLVRVYARQQLEIDKLNGVLARLVPEGWGSKGGDADQAEAA
jgi:hypothetical protein